MFLLVESFYAEIQFIEITSVLLVIKFLFYTQLKDPFWVHLSDQWKNLLYNLDQNGNGQSTWGFLACKLFSK